MRRKLFNLAAGLSLAVVAATVVLWVRGNWQCDQVNWFSQDHGVCFSSANSVMAVMFGPNYKGPDAIPPFESGWRYQHYPAKSDDRDPDQDQVRCQIPTAKYHRLGWLGFAYDPNHLQTFNGQPKMVWYSSHRIYFPSWSLAAIAGILPAMWCWRRRRERVRRKFGRCVNCGYDLRGAPERCPECGEAPPHNPPLERTAAAV
jgi:hypothetical protein